jgi:hypothetical protein
MNLAKEHQIAVVIGNKEEVGKICSIEPLGEISNPGHLHVQQLQAVGVINVARMVILQKTVLTLASILEAGIKDKRVARALNAVKRVISQEIVLMLVPILEAGIKDKRVARAINVVRRAISQENALMLAPRQGMVNKGNAEALTEVMAIVGATVMTEVMEEIEEAIEERRA